MMDIIAQTSISEAILLFVLLFVLPGLGFLVMKLRKYEALYGPLPNEKKGRKKKRKAEEPAQVEAEAVVVAAADSVPGDVYPYKPKPFMSPPERSCLQALREALGPEVEVYPKVALWETVEPTDKAAGYLARLHGRDYDFLVCDKRTGSALTGVMFNPGKGRPAGPVDEMRRICAAAEAGLVFIDMADSYDGKKLKDALGIPDLDI